MPFSRSSAVCYHGVIVLFVELVLFATLYGAPLFAFAERWMVTHSPRYAKNWPIVAAYYGLVGAVVIGVAPDGQIAVRRATAFGESLWRSCFCFCRRRRVNEGHASAAGAGMTCATVPSAARNAAR